MRPTRLSTALLLGQMFFNLSISASWTVQRGSGGGRGAGKTHRRGAKMHDKLILRRIEKSGDVYDKRGRQSRALGGSDSAASSDVGDCILLFGAFCNGNMGDLIQPVAMEHLLSSVVPDQCFWYSHPWEEDNIHERHMGEFFGGNSSRVIPLTSDHAAQVNQFKALVIGGGGVFAAQHRPLHADKFAKALTVPIVIMGVGASYAAKQSSTLIERAAFVSGRDATSVKSFSSVLQRTRNPAVEPKDVELVRDPVLSDKMLSDTKGKCWKQSEDGDKQPLCFILPASNTESTTAMHKHLVERVVRPGDVFVNVFPKHQEEIEKHAYQGEVLQIVTLSEFTDKLCSCRAIISSRLHGAILGLHMGVPTFGAFHVAKGNKVPELMLDIMQLPEQFFLLNEFLTREVVEVEVDAVRRMYAIRDRRASIHARLSSFYDDFRAHAQRVLFDVVGVVPPKDVVRLAAETKTLPTTSTSKSEPPAEPERAPTVAGGGVGEVVGTSIPKAGNVSPAKTERVTTAKAVPEETVVSGTSTNEGVDSNTTAKDRGAVATGEKKTIEERPPPKPEAEPSVSKKPTASPVLKVKDDGEEPEVPVEAVHPLPAAQLATTKVATTEPEQAAVSKVFPPVEGGSISDALVVNEYVAAILLIASIVALALLPSGGIPRRASHDLTLEKAGVGVGEEGIISAQNDVSVQKDAPCCMSESGFGDTLGRSAELLVQRSTPGVAATSSKMLFMLNFAVWVFLAMGFGGYSKSYLRDTRDPVGLLILQGSMGVIVLSALGHFGVVDLYPAREPTPAAARQAWMAAMLHTSQALLTNFAVLVGGVAVTNALKAMEPVAAAVFSYMLLGRNCSSSRVAALITIVGGIILLTSRGSGGGEGGRGGGGGGRGEGTRADSAVVDSAVIAVVAVCCNALRNVVLKKGDPVAPHQTLLACSTVAMVIGMVLLVLRVVFSAMVGMSGLATTAMQAMAVEAEQDSNGDQAGWFHVNGVNAALCFVGYNFASFNLLARLNPVGHAVGNSCKRMLVFASGLLFLGEVMTVRQLGGATVALVGVLAYNVAGAL